MSTINLANDEGHPEIIKSWRERKHPRTDLASLNKVLDEKVSFLPVEIASSTSGKFKGMILDFSENGCRIAVPVQLKKEELIKVGFIVKRHNIITRAIIKWISSHSHVHLAGMEFQGLPNDAKEFLWSVGAIAMMDAVEIARIKEALR
jgi:hypothetical protein